MNPVICPSCGYAVKDQGYRGRFWECKPADSPRTGCIVASKSLKFWPGVHPAAVRAFFRERKWPIPEVLTNG